MSEADIPNNQQFPEPTSNAPLNFNWKIETSEIRPQPPATIENIAALTQNLQGRDLQLLHQGAQLEQTLRECQQALQAQMVRSQAQETLFLQQAEELNAAQEQATRLFRELESSHQVAHRQQVLIETLTQQLEASQQRVAQLERECALTQQRYSEQGEQLFDAEHLCKELRSRLYRQQRHTLQFKAALEKCLEAPAVNWENITGQTNSTIPVTPRLAPVPKAQPIPPWSAQFDRTWEESETPELQISHSQVYAFPTPDASEGNIIDLASEQELARMLVEHPELAEVLKRLEEEDSPIVSESSAEIAASLPAENQSDILPVAAQAETIAEQPEKPISPPSDIFSQPSWPAPVVYPLRPTKGLKSIAAVELPKLPRLSTQLPG